ncbi:hypothetical protein [Roseibium sp. SCP14]
MLDGVAGISRNDVVYVPLHIQPLLWSPRSDIDLTQRVDNFLMLRWIKVN